MIKHKDLSPWQCGKLQEKYREYEQVTKGNLQAGDLLILTRRTGDNTLVDASPVQERYVGSAIGDLPVLRKSHNRVAWYWLTNQEREGLLHFNPDAEQIVNREFGFGEFTHTKYQPIPAHGKPWLPEKHIIVHERVGWMVTEHHPMNSDYTRTVQRTCIAFAERSPYMLNFDKLVMAVMKPELLKRLHWGIYAPSGTGTQHIYLICDSMRGQKIPSLSLYVPVAYFSTKDWSIVEKFHEEVACGYYRGTGFKVTPEQTKEWETKTRALLDSQEAKMLRVLVEEDYCK